MESSTTHTICLQFNYSAIILRTESNSTEALHNNQPKNKKFLSIGLFFAQLPIFIDV